jgi:PAS domain S-box-containing protein
MHRLLKRQLKKHLLSEETPAEIKKLLEDIDASYQNFDEDYKRLERILELSSQELFKTNNLLNNEKDKIKEELAESYKKLREVDKAVDSSFSVSYTDTKGIITDVNKRFCETSGYTEKELIGKSHVLISSGYHTKQFWKSLWQTISKGEIWYGEIKNRNKKGEEYWEATNIIPFYNSHGEVYQYMAIKTDITQKKLAEGEIKKLGLVAEKTLNAVITTDAAGIATWANEGFERITGYKVSELIGKKPGDLLQGKDTDPKTIKAMRTAIKKGEPFDGEIYNYGKNGNGYWLSINITPLKDENNKLTGFIAIENDITEKKEFEEELRISEERWKYALSGGQDGVWDWDVETNELFVSDSWKEMFGFTEKDPDPKFPDAWELVHPDDKEAAQKMFEDYLNGKIKTYNNEYRLQCKDGTYKHILDRGKIIESEETDGRIKRRFIGTHTDITPLKEAEQKAQMSELIIKNSPTLLIRWTPNFKLNVEFISENISSYGYNAQDWINQNVAFTHFVHPDDVKPVTRKVLQSFRDKIERVLLRFRLRNSEGDYHWIDSDNKIVWNGNEKSAAYFQGVLTDITDQIEAEEKLKESENRFRSLVQNSTDITTILNEQGEILFKSPSFYRTFAFEEEDVIGKNIFEFFHPDDVEKAHKEFFKGLDRGGISDPIEFRFKHKNGSYLFVESVGNNLLDTPGIEGIVINSRDITDRKEAEEQRKTLREFYEIILNKIPTDVVVFDNKHRYLFANEMAIKNPEKRAFIIGKDDYDYCEKYGRDKAIAHSRRAIFNKVAYAKEQIEFEEPLETPNGTVWVLRRMFPLLNDEGELMNVIGFGLDITERKAAEKKLKESQERLTLATEAAQLGIWDWDLINDNLLWDKEMYSLYDIDPKDFDGDYDAFEKTLHPDDKQRIFDSVQATIDGKQGDFKDTFRIITKNNEIRYIAAISKLFRQEKTKKPYRIIGVNFDVTERTLAEQKILKSQAELEEAQHIARIGSWEIDMRTQTVTWSKEMRTIHEIDDDYEVTLNNVHLFYTPETREPIVEAFKKALHEKEPFDIEAQVVTKSGKIIDARTKAIPVIEEGRVPYVRGVFQDITQQKEAQRQLKEYTAELESINKELDQFAYIVSHDLKAPLRAINNLSMWIEEDLEGKLEGDTQHQFNLLRGRVSRLEDLINGILSYSRAGRISVNPSTVRVRTLLDGIIEMLSPPKEFKISIPEKLPTLTTEKIALEQIFSNFISNAIKYNKNPKPTIKITCKELDKFYKFGIADNGDGIEPEFHEKIFVIFQTLEARDKVESTGVGLAIVKKIIDEKGGEVWVESEKGKGSTFYFTWPKE